MDLGGEFVAWETGRVKLLDVRLVVLLCGGVVNSERVGFGEATNGNTLHGL